MKIESTIKDNHKYYVDVLRIISTFAVVGIHTFAEVLRTMTSFSLNWCFYSIVEIILHFSVPVFLMISGCLFLQEGYKIDIKKLYLKNILRLLTAGIFWVIVYFIYAYIVMGKNGFISTLFSEENYYHLWYIPMCITIYMFIPILKKISENKNLLRYTLIFIFITQSLLPTITSLNIPYIEYISIIYDRFKLNSDILMYVGYVLLGYYLSKKEFSKRLKAVIYTMGIVGIIMTFVLTVCFVEPGSDIGRLMGYNYLGILLETIAVFVLIKSIFQNRELNKRTCKILKAVSSFSFGTYLVHLLVLNIFKNIQPFTEVPYMTVILTIIIFIISMIISAILNKIPFINKYIV